MLVFCLLTAKYQLCPVLFTIILYLQSECIAKRYPNYVKNVIENIILTSYADKSKLVASLDGYVASSRMVSCDKLKQQVSQHFVAQQDILSRDMNLLSRRRLQVLVVVLRHDTSLSTAFFWYIINTYSMKSYVL